MVIKYVILVTTSKPIVFYNLYVIVINPFNRIAEDDGDQEKLSQASCSPTSSKDVILLARLSAVLHILQGAFDW